ncbi:MAG: hypothetical protein J2P47_07235, partial [Acetobacteraceae bacterium]|nr:hypothetical protein [Acetobacteraceae bacterium]
MCIVRSLPPHADLNPVAAPRNAVQAHLVTAPLPFRLHLNPRAGGPSTLVLSEAGLPPRGHHGMAGLRRPTPARPAQSRPSERGFHDLSQGRVVA